MRLRDPIRTVSEFLIKEGLATASEIEQIDNEVQEQVNQAADEALGTPASTHSKIGNTICLLP